MRPSILVSGGYSTAVLVPGLAEEFDVMVAWNPTHRALKGKVEGLIDPAFMRDLESSVLNETLRGISLIFHSIASGDLAERWSSLVGPDDLKTIDQWLLAELYAPIRLAVGAIFMAQYLKDRHDLRGIVVHNDIEPPLKALALWGKVNGVPVIHVPHAVYHDNVWRTSPGTDPHDEVNAGFIAAISPFQARWYLERGATNVRVTGNPSWDAWLNLPFDRDQAKRLFKLDNDRKVITLLTTWSQQTNLLGFHDAPMAGLRVGLEAARALASEYDLILQVHPRDAGMLPEYAKRVSDLGLDAVVQSQHYRLAMRAADVVVTIGPSNALLEAVILGTPAVGIGGSWPGLPVCDFDPKSVVEAIVDTPIDRTILEDCIGPLPALGNVLEYVKEIVNA